MSVPRRGLRRSVGTDDGLAEAVPQPLRAGAGDPGTPALTLVRPYRDVGRRILSAGGVIDPAPPKRKMRAFQDSIGRLGITAPTEFELFMIPAR